MHYFFFFGGGGWNLDFLKSCSSGSSKAGRPPQRWEAEDPFPACGFRRPLGGFTEELHGAVLCGASLRRHIDSSGKSEGGGDGLFQFFGWFLPVMGNWRASLSTSGCCLEGS